MHRILVDEKRWIGERRFLHALNYCMLLPGPEAHQLAIYIGWLMNGVAGGLIAGALFVLPGFLALMALSLVYVIYGQLTLVAGLFFGLKAAVLAIVVQAVARVGRRALKGRLQLAIAALAFLALSLLHTPFPLVILAAAATGLIAARRGWSPAAGHRGANGGLADADSLLGEAAPGKAGASPLRTGLICAALWLTPVAALLLLPGHGGTFGDIAGFFSRMAVVTFGGAYAVLAYVAQQAVGHYSWLRPGEMVDGLGLAETTPGPLIIVNQFVGFLAAFRAPGALPPLLAGVLGAVLTSWVTFLPSFVWIFLGAPYAEALRGARALNAALAAISAAVVGVILNLAVWFSLRVLFADVQPVHAFGLSLDIPVFRSLNAAALVLALGAAAGLFALKLGPLKVLGACAAAGLLYRLVVP